MRGAAAANEAAILSYAPHVAASKACPQSLKTLRVTREGHGKLMFRKEPKGFRNQRVSCSILSTVRALRN